jgi:hypothetical protein
MKHTLKVVISSALSGRVYYLKRTVPFDDFNYDCVYVMRVVAKSAVFILEYRT